MGKSTTDFWARSAFPHVCAKTHNLKIIHSNVSPLFGEGKYVNGLSTLKPVESPTIKTFHREQKRQSFIEKDANKGLNMLCSERLWRIMVCLIVEFEGKNVWLIWKCILKGSSQTSWTRSRRQSFDYNDRSVWENSTGKQVNWQPVVASGWNSSVFSLARK